MTQPRKRKQQPASQTLGPRAAAPAPAKAVLTAAQLRAAMTWEFEIAPGHVMTCRHLGQEDVLFLGILPLPLFQGITTEGVSAVQGDGGNINPDVIPVLEDYAVRVALEPRIIARPVPGQPNPEEPASSVGVWHLNIATLARLFTQGIARVVEVRPFVSTFPRQDEPATGGPALHGREVRPGSELMATSGPDA